MNRRLLTLAGVLLFLLAGSLIAQVPDSLDGSATPDQTDIANRDTIPQESKIKFFAIDYATLSYQEDWVQVEIFALIDRTFLALEETDDGVQARYEITFRVFSEDSLITGDRWDRTDFSPVKDARVTGQKLPEIMKYVVKPGDYLLEVEVLDKIANVFRKDDLRVSIEAYSETELEISDIILASNIQPARGDVGEFNHNNLLVLPNADRLYGENASQIFYYVELYNLTMGEGNTYTIKRQIRNDNVGFQYNLPVRTRDVVAADLVDHDRFAIAAMTTGSYDLIIEVTDNSTGNVAIKSQTFWIFRPGMDAENGSILNPGFDIAGMSEADIDGELKMIRYIIPPKIQKMVKKLNGFDAKRQFLANFWKANDEDRSTLENETRTKYMDRVRDSNTRYGSHQVEGWKTDRGRIYCMLGEPDYIANHPFEPDFAKPFQIWS